jgi:hypothetical protein
MPSSDLSSGNPPSREEGNAEDDHIDALNEASEILCNQEEDPDFIPWIKLPRSHTTCGHHHHSETLSNVFGTATIEEPDWAGRTGLILLFPSLLEESSRRKLEEE